MGAPTCSAALDAPSYIRGGQMLLRVTYSDPDTRRVTLTIIAKDDAGNTSAPVTVRPVIDPVTIAVSDPAVTWTKVASKTGEVTYRALAATASTVRVTATDRSGKTATAQASYGVTAPESTPVPAPSPTPAPTGSWADYYRRWSNGPNPTGDPSWFPVGVWFQDPQKDVYGVKGGSVWKSIGVNLNIGLWEDQWWNIRFDGAKATSWHSFVAPHRRTTIGDDELFPAYLLGDEFDMFKVNGNPADMPASVLARANEQRAADPTRPVYINYGKGMAIRGWVGYHIDPGSTYERDMKKYADAADLISADMYGYTDPWEGASLEGAWAYGALVDNVRYYAQAPEKPVWGFVEGTSPFSEGDTITPDEMESAIWCMIVHGANGILYFSHDFADGGDDEMLRTPAIKDRAARVNARIHRLAPILNTVSTSGVTVTRSNAVPVTHMHKIHGGSHYVLAQTDGTAQLPLSGSTVATFSVPVQSGTVTVVDEGRTIQIMDGKFTDTFGPYGFHVYKF